MKEGATLKRSSEPFEPDIGRGGLYYEINLHAP